MKELAKCIYGSQSYRLDGPDSDKDYKVFLYPTFDDLYANHRLDKGDLPHEYPRNEHYSPMDARTFVKNCFKGNVNCLEYVFSTEWDYVDADFKRVVSMLQQLFEHSYLLVCWETFFASLEGMVKNSLDRYGVGRKSMSRAYYFYMLAVTLVVDDFCMSERTWRGNTWNDMVRKMRFNDAAWMPSREELDRSLHYVKEEAQKSAERMRKYKPEMVEEMVAQGKEVEDFMKNLVAKKLMEELK